MEKKKLHCSIGQDKFNDNYRGIFFKKEIHAMCKPKDRKK